MLQFVCHPALENLLTTSKEGMNCVKLTNNAVLISDFLPQASQPIHACLLEAAKYRLFHPTEFIFITSFFPKEKLHPFDTFGILSLTGTEFIRLPFEKDQFLVTLEEKQKTEFNLSKVEWETFAIRACKALLKEKISVLKHGKRLELISHVTSPLGGSCRSISINPTKFKPIIIQQLQSVRQFILEELSEIIDMASIAKNLNDSYLQNVVQFADSLNNLKNFSFSPEFNVTPLLNLINTVDDSYDKIKNI